MQYSTIRGAMLCVTATLLSLLLTIAVMSPTVISAGTTRNLENIFKGRCHEYREVLNPSLFTEGNLTDCEELWSLFSEAFMNKDPCDVQSEDYNDFAMSVLHYMPPDKSMFWSGTRGFVHEYTNLGARATALEDTMLGYMADSLVWCGQKEEPGINYETCPGWGTCDDSAEMAYWRAVSEVFATESEGLVRVMLNGSRAPAYRDDSIFATVELPNLNPDKVTGLEAIVVHNYDMPVKESCNNGSMLTLKEEVEKLNIPYACVDDPADIRYLLCVDAVNEPECKEISIILGHVSKASSHVTAHVMPPLLVTSIWTFINLMS